MGLDAFLSTSCYRIMCIKYLCFLSMTRCLTDMLSVCSWRPIHCLLCENTVGILGSLLLGLGTFSKLQLHSFVLLLGVHGLVIVLPLIITFVTLDTFAIQIFLSSGLSGNK